MDCNSLVMSLLLQSMQPNTNRSYMLLSKAYVITLTYSQIGNDARVYELMKRAHETKQREKTLSEYLYRPYSIMARH